MALTAQQAMECRHFMGYSVAGDVEAQPYREMGYTNTSFSGMSIDYRLAHLSAEEESRITGFYLPSLRAREADIQGAGDTLDTDRAAVWRRNPHELAERRSLYRSTRLDLCAFLGMPPGSGLQPDNRLIRA